MTASLEERLDVEYDGEIPPDIDEAALYRMEAVARALDESIQIPGTNASVGIDPILGIFPIAGDLVSAGLSLYIVAEAANLGVSYTTLLWMIANVSIDLLGGSIPYVGTLFDSFWKANRRNVDRAFAELTERQTGEDETETAVDIPIQTD